MIACLLCFSRGRAAAAERPHGLAARPAVSAYLQMPERADGAVPRLLSETGVFQDLTRLQPRDGLIPYDLIVPFWSDGAAKARWVSVPTGQKIRFAPTGEWVFPRGTVFVKTFLLATNESQPSALRRLEPACWSATRTAGFMASFTNGGRT